MKRHLKYYAIPLLHSAKSLNTQEKEVSVKIDKNQCYLITSFFLVMCRVIWDYVYDCQNDATVQNRKTLFHTLATP